MKGIHNIKAGIVYEQTFLREHDNFGIVDPTLNAVCLNADGSPDTKPDLRRTPRPAEARQIRVASRTRISSQSWAATT